MLRKKLPKRVCPPRAIAVNPHRAVRSVQPALMRVLVLDLFNSIHAKDKAYFRESREKRFGMKLEAVAAEPAKKLADFRGTLDPLRPVVVQNLFLSGKGPGFADYILFGTFQHKLAYGIVASLGVALAAVYMIRFYQRSMHNRVGPDVESRDLALPDLASLVPLVGVILALAVYPQIVLQRSEPTANQIVSTATGGTTGAVLARNLVP